MGRYSSNREENIFERILGGLFLVLLGLAALGVLAGGVKWLWLYFVKHWN
jgi:hypothetical protein